jgi:hypothetical protein
VFTDELLPRESVKVIEISPKSVGVAGACVQGDAEDITPLLDKVSPEKFPIPVPPGKLLDDQV